MSDEDDEFSVDKILDKRTRNGKIEYLISWKGCGSEADSWEQKEAINPPQLVKNFENSFTDSLDDINFPGKGENEIYDGDPQVDDLNIVKAEPFEHFSPDDLSSILSRTMEDLQAMKDKYEVGLQMYEAILESASLLDQVEGARDLVKTGFQLHDALLEFIKAACELNGVVPVESVIVANVKDENVNVKEEEEENEFLPSDPDSSDFWNDPPPVKKKSKGTKTFTCDTCDKCFDKKWKLKRHINWVHTSRKEFRCEVEDCLGQFSTPKYLRAHMLRYHRDYTKKEREEKDKTKVFNAFKCDLCDEKLSTQTGLLMHHKAKHGFDSNESFDCTECPKSFKLRIHLSKHLRDVHNIKTAKLYKCQICFTEFRLFNEYRAHRRTNHLDIAPPTPSDDSEQQNGLDKPDQAGHHNAQDNSGHSNNLHPDMVKREDTDQLNRKMVNNKMHMYESYSQMDMGFSEADLHSNENLKLYSLAMNQNQLSSENKTFSLMNEVPSVDKDKLSSTCDICNEQFKDGAELNIHKIKKHTTTPFKCALCSKYFKTQEMLDEHHKKLCNCFICGETVCPITQATHRKKKHPDLIATTFGTFSEQPVLPSDDKNCNYICEICCLGFKDAALLNLHKIKKHTETPFKCQYCSLDCFSEKNLKKHQAKLFNCDYCEIVLCGFKLMRKHKKTQHPEMFDPKPVVCDCCGFKSGSKAELARHMIKHTGEKPFVCKLCQRGFTQKGSLTEHMTLHTGERPFECDQCKKTFRIGYQLKTHYRLHTGERPYSCDMCGKTFHLNGERTKHVKKCRPVKADIDAD